jgi:hypothetical protein
VVLAVGGAHDDRAEHLVVAEAELAQRVIGEQLEAIAVVAVVLERLLERRPVVDRAVGNVVIARLLLDPGRELAGDLALPLDQELVVLGAQRAALGGIDARRLGADGRGARGTDLLALLPAADLAAPRVVGRRSREVRERPVAGDRRGAAAHGEQQRGADEAGIPPHSSRRRTAPPNRRIRACIGV